jgi:hypothetical protein
LLIWEKIGSKKGVFTQKMTKKTEFPNKLVLIKEIRRDNQEGYRKNNKI